MFHHEPEPEWLNTALTLMVMTLFILLAFISVWIAIYLVNL